MLVKAQDLLTKCSRWVLDPSLTRWNSSTRGTYNYNKSHTAISLNETFFELYGSGLVKGKVINETVTIAGWTFDNVTMGIAQTAAPALLGRPFIGLLGLGPQASFSMMSLLAL